MAIGDGGPVDGDRDAARAFFEQRGLQPDPASDRCAHLLHADGTALAFDGHPSDLHVDSYDTEEPWGGGIWHASLSDTEVEFVYDLCRHVGLAICNHQGDPLMIGLVGVHSQDDLVELDDGAVLVGSAEELRAVLAGGFDQFADWRDRVVGDG